MLKQPEMRELLENFYECQPYFVALSDRFRQQILLLLAEAGTVGMNVTEIASVVKLSRPAISHHLKILKDSDMIVSHKKGTNVYYFIYLKKDIEQMRTLLRKIEERISCIDVEDLKKEAPWILDAESAEKSSEKKPEPKHGRFPSL